MRLSVTELDAFRRYRDTEDASLDDLLAYLRRETEPTENMLAGKAFHSALETIPAGSFDLLEADGYRFAFKGDYAMNLPPVRELKGEMVLKTPSGPVTLVGIVDGLNGRAVRDYKLTGRFDAERYADSFQWRCYLVMFDAFRFDYDVFVGSEDTPKDWLITDYHPLRFYAYPAMREDVIREVTEFAAFVKAHLPERMPAYQALVDKFGVVLQP